MSDTTARGEHPFELDESQLVELFADDSGVPPAVAHISIESHDDLLAAHTGS